MEQSPITLAQEHAERASAATASNNPTVALDEHTQAAGEFAKAASHTKNVEAARTLRLLEAHHAQLAALLKQPNGASPKPTAEAKEGDEKTVSTSAAVAELRARANAPNMASSMSARRSANMGISASLHSPRRMPPREMSSSIASNLASARGIRRGNTNASPRTLSPAVTAANAPGSFDTQPTGTMRARNKPSWAPPTAADEQVEPAPTPNAEGGFNRFYSSFESLFSKLGPALAFTGLPLVSEESNTTPTTPNIHKETKEIVPYSNRKSDWKQEQHHEVPKTGTNKTDPNLSLYFTPAALRSIEGRNSRTNESFYVVPTSGQTVPYAKIHHHTYTGTPHQNSFDDDDDFVDAKEHPSGRAASNSKSSSPTRSRNLGLNREGSGGFGRNLLNALGVRESVVQFRTADPRGLSTEELVAEVLGGRAQRDALQAIISDLGSRLNAFENASQKAGRALDRSVRELREREEKLNGGSGGDGKGKIEGLERRVRELEEVVEQERRERLGLEKKVGEKEEVIRRYREKWEELKRGAKERSRKAREGSSSQAQQDAAPAGSGAAGGSEGGKFMSG